MVDSMIRVAFMIQITALLFGCSNLTLEVNYASTQKVWQEKKSADVQKDSIQNTSQESAAKTNERRLQDLNCRASDHSTPGRGLPGYNLNSLR